jgi:hypothetical protein
MDIDVNTNLTSVNVVVSVDIQNTSTGKQTHIQVQRRNQNWTPKEIQTEINQALVDGGNIVITQGNIVS